MTYNKSEIMKTAWEFVKSMNVSLSYALKASWERAKQEAKERHVKERKDNVFYSCRINRTTRECMVLIDGNTYHFRKELRENGFDWLDEKKIWKKIFNDQKSAEKFLYKFNCTKSWR